MTTQHWVDDVLTEPTGEAQADGWWHHYRALLGSSMSTTALSVLDTDCGYILNRGILGAGPPGSPGWPVGRMRSGLVMGSVQSGKTASMMGVIAKAIDAGVDIVIVLAGTRLTLWRQTYDRIRAQLDVEPGAQDEGRRRILVPSPAVMRSEASIAPKDVYRILTKPGSRIVEGGTPLVAVVMKNDMHLQALGHWIRDMARKNSVRRPVHALVIDDEADDGSILDSPGSAEKQIPHSVEQLWKPGIDSGDGSFWKSLHVTYLAYTATPQANLLQQDLNPLSPRDFICALRVPGPAGQVMPRDIEYREPRGPRNHYTGGETFYRTHRQTLVSVVPASADPLPDALRAYFVAGAHKILGDPTREEPHISRGKVYSSRQRAAQYAPRPHTMLVHPSAKVVDHFDMAAQILAWTRQIDRDAARALLDEGERLLGADDLERRIKVEEGEWRRWHDSFNDASDELAARDGQDAPPRQLWTEVIEVLRRDVFPYAEIAVINSDPKADERPSFAPERGLEGGWCAGRDLSTIFVSGNVMARGLTLEGLTTSVFNRTTPNPLADTQMQMQRWFGYRGKDLHLTRLFIDEGQLELFSEYHVADTALKRQIITEMNSGKTAPEPTVFQGQGFRATGKISNLRSLPVHPGRAPYFVGTNGVDDPNNDLVATVFSGSTLEAEVDGTSRGVLLPGTITAQEAADLLDRYEYRWRDDSTDQMTDLLWSNLAQLISAPPAIGALRLLRREPIREPEPKGSLGLVTPATVAAFLRLWDAVASYPSRGLVPYNAPLGDLSGRYGFSPAPRFRVGLRYGGGDAVSQGPWSGSDLRPRPSRRHFEGDRLTGSWGSRRPDAPAGSYSSDEHFDYHALGEQPPPWDGSRSGWRPMGDPGLILFQLIEQVKGQIPAVALGVVLPVGGPSPFPAHTGGVAG